MVGHCRLLDRQIAAAIRADAQGLSEQWEGGGLEALQSTIEDRLAQNVDDDAIYLLTDKGMHPLAGNLTGWPAIVVAPDTAYELMVSRAGVVELDRKLGEAIDIYVNNRLVRARARW